MQQKVWIIYYFKKRFRLFEFPCCTLSRCCILPFVPRGKYTHRIGSRSHQPYALCDLYVVGPWIRGQSSSSGNWSLWCKYSVHLDPNFIYLSFFFSRLIFSFMKCLQTTWCWTFSVIRKHQVVGKTNCAGMKWGKSEKVLITFTSKQEVSLKCKSPFCGKVWRFCCEVTQG